jgi:HD superfamily phosphohydrolase
MVKSTTIKKNTKQDIIIKDPLYKQILVKYKHKSILDSKEFQRLRYIKQTSFSDSVYPSASHSRFTHSIGVYHLMRKVLSNKLNIVTSEEKENLMLAGLLHDLGHGPFSHIWEHVFPDFDHEEMTHKILLKKGYKDVVDILQKKTPFWQLITSTIDMDKLDYMARDSHFSGVSYGVAEVDFIIQHMYVKDNKLVIKPSAISSVEDLITQRVNLFKTVYLHKTPVERDFILENIFKRVRELIRTNIDVPMNKHLKTFFLNTNTMDNFLAINDIVVTANIFEWCDHKDKLLSKFCNMFTSRKKFNVKNLTHHKVSKTKIKQAIKKLGLELEYHYKEVSIPIEIIQTPIHVEIEGKLVNIEKLSELIKFYKTQTWSVDFVIYPKEVDKLL